MEYYIYIYIIYTTVDRDRPVGIATLYWLSGPGTESRWEARFSASVQTGPGAHPASCTMGTGSFPGVKRPGRGVDHPPPSSAEVKERVELYVYSPSGPRRPVLGCTYLNTHNIVDRKFVSLHTPVNSMTHVTYPTVTESNKTSYKIGHCLIRTGV
jgi:hypothetical protein